MYDLQYVVLGTGCLRCGQLESKVKLQVRNVRMDSAPNLVSGTGSSRCGQLGRNVRLLILNVHMYSGCGCTYVVYLKIFFLVLESKTCNNVHMYMIGVIMYTCT